MGPLQPGYKPSLVMIFACLGDIHAERHQKTKRKADLDEAVWATRLALSISSADHPITTTLLNNLASGLWRRYRSTGHEDDLHQALFYGLQALDSLSPEDSDRAVVLGTLGAIHASLYDCRGDFKDLHEAISITRKSIDIATRCAGTTLVFLFNNLGAYLWTQHCLTGRREDLDESVVSFIKALECPIDNTVDRVTCLINSGQVLTQRYNRTGQLEDLSCALENAQEAMRLDPRNGYLATLLKRLDRLLDRRREHISPVHWSKSHWNANRESGKLLTLLAVFILIVAMYAYHPRTEILLSIVAFPSGIIYHWMISRRPTAKQRISMEDAFAPISSIREHLSSLGGSHEYAPKLLAMPLIPVPFASSLRGIQTSDFSEYSSLLYNQRGQSIHSVRPERMVKSRPSTCNHRDRDEKVHKGRHRGHRPMSPPRGGHNRMPTAAVTTPSFFVKCESPKDSFPPVVRNAGPQVEVELSRNEMGSSRRRRETHVTPLLRNDSSMQRSVGADSGYGPSSARHDGGIDIEYNNEDQSAISTDEQHHQPNASPSSYSRPATPPDTRPAEDISSLLVPSQKLWAELGSKYSEHKIWEEQESSPEEAEKEQVPVVRQGHTKLKMGTNSGLAMGNVTSMRAQVVGCVISGELQSRRQHSCHEEMSRTSRLDDVQSEIILQEEEVQITPVPEIADFEDSVSANASVHDVEVQLQAPLTSIVEDLMHNQVPQVVEVDDKDPVFVEQEDFNIDLVDQLAREYLESSTL